jgi:hypothetical protein
VIKTKEMIVDYRKWGTERAPILIDWAVVEQVESFKFFGVHITNKLTWSKHTKIVVKREQQNLFALRRQKKNWHGSTDSQMVLCHAGERGPKSDLTETEFIQVQTENDKS